MVSHVYPTQWTCPVAPGRWGETLILMCGSSSRDSQIGVGHCPPGRQFLPQCPKDLEQAQSAQPAIARRPSVRPVPKFFPQLYYASSNEGAAPKASIMPEPCPKREVPKPGKPVADSQV